MPRRLAVDTSTLADKIRRILAIRGLSLSDVSRASRSLTPYNPLQHIPYTLYSSLRNRLFTPNLFQVAALSSLTGYRLADWLAIFGFSLHDVPRFQAGFPALRTVELDAGSCQPGSLIPWFHENQAADFSAPMMPLSRWLALTTPTCHPTPIDSGSEYRYAKIGIQDAFAFPDLVPGSIVRITAVRSSSKVPPIAAKSKKRLFLVEHSKGFICSQLAASTAGKFVLCSRQLPYAPVELEAGRHATVLGFADFELRPLQNFDKPTVPLHLGRFWTPLPLPQDSRAAHIGEFIRNARIRAGLSFRDAARRTRTIARTLDDSRYYCAPASLSDYEAQRTPPRHIHKLLSICAVYFASVDGIFEAAGVNPNASGTVAMPAEFMMPTSVHDLSVSESSDFFSELGRRIGGLPYFLHNSLDSVFGLKNISVRDVFWAGGIRESSHPRLAGALFLVVDRKRKNPRPALSCPKWAQPVYVVQKRGGSYLCGFCTLQNEMLILRSCFAGLPTLVRLRNRVDAEVVGKVVGIARQLR
jgi:transcriptional regulator with XRE-family HTH domain